MDVAIVMKVMNAAFKGNMDSLVLVAGDGDFKDMLDFVSETLQKKIIVFGWNSCTSYVLKAQAEFYPLDDIWDHISEPNSQLDVVMKLSINVNKACKFYALGCCKKGESCKYEHIESVNKSQSEAAEV